MGDHFQFGSVFIKKQVTKPKFKKKTKTEPKSVQTDRFRFSLVRFGLVFLDKNRFKPVWLGFFPVWLGFFRFWFGSVRFSRFQSYKTKTEPVGFFKILIGFFSRFGFFDYFFRFNRFLIFCSPLIVDNLSSSIKKMEWTMFHQLHQKPKKK